MAQVQLEESALEAVVRIDRPAKVGERLVLSCAAADPRNGLYRLEEAPRLPQEGANGESEAAEGMPLAYVGEPGEADEEGEFADGALADDRALTLGAAHV